MPTVLSTRPSHLTKRHLPPSPQLHAHLLPVPHTYSSPINLTPLSCTPSASRSPNPKTPQRPLIGRIRRPSASHHHPGAAHPPTHPHPHPHPHPRKHVNVAMGQHRLPRSSATHPRPAAAHRGIVPRQVRQASRVRSGVARPLLTSPSGPSRSAQNRQLITRFPGTRQHGNAVAARRSTASSSSRFRRGSMPLRTTLYILHTRGTRGSARLRGGRGVWRSAGPRLLLLVCW